ncbi:MAG: hypothetical protein JSS78_08780 [Bacteroidetes bacterium]|nr:hypothetical protein [Bacteroidota bacterium]
MKLTLTSLLFMMIMATISCSTSSKTTDTAHTPTAISIHKEDSHSTSQPINPKQKAPESTNQLDQPQFTQ